MRNLLAFLAAVVLIVGITGWYRNWYCVEPQSADVGKMAFRVEVDCLQIARDAQDAVRALQKAFSKTEKDAEKKSEVREVSSQETQPALP